jgi:hypothetical protein
MLEDVEELELEPQLAVVVGADLASDPPPSEREAWSILTNEERGGRGSGAADAIDSDLSTQATWAAESSASQLYRFCGNPRATPRWRGSAILISLA